SVCALPALACVALSSGSTPVRTPSSAAASATVRHIGPGVSCECEIGTMPERLRSPTVGLMPTSEHAALGLTMEPSVSVPIAAAAKLADEAPPEPELDPDGVRSSAYGL